MKHVITSANDYVSIKDNTTNYENYLHSTNTPIPTTMTTPKSTIKVDKRFFQERCYEVFVQMVENN
jgi:hypothetical protein